MLKIAYFKEIITPEVGCYLAGYSLNDISVMKLDDLYATGLCVDDGTKKVLIISLDLLGLDESYIRKVRTQCAEILSVEESAVMLSPTHTHTGPESRTIASKPEQLHTAYLDKLEKILLEATRKLAGADFLECKAYFYSSQCDENRSRRYVSADNLATFTPHRRELLPGIDAMFADKEFGLLYFQNAATGQPVYVVGNYAAHPLAGHSPGLGGLRISADFPGAFRDYVLSETGAEAMFISGAAGDMVPREDELGFHAAKEMGYRLGKAALGGMIDAPRNPGRFFMENAKVGSSLRAFTVPLRQGHRRNTKRLQERPDVTLQVQCIAIGEVAFVGVPGEVCAELGQEIKWHSPFRRTYIAYDATSYMSYIGPANFLVSGGYEGNSQVITARGGLAMVNTAVDALFDLHEELYPSEDPGNPYPDNNLNELVNIPPNRKKA